MNAGNWVLSEIVKINPQQEKPVCPNRKNYFRKTQKIRANPQK